MDQNTILNFVNEADSMEGFEQLDSSKMAVPFLKIAQSLSPQLKKTKAEYIEGLEEGDIFNQSTKEVYGKSVELIILKYENVFIEWKPDRGGLVSYHTPENADRLAVDKSDFRKWITADGNELVEYYSYYCLVVGHEKQGIVILSLSSSALKTARELNRIMTTHIMDDGRVAKPYYLVFQMDSIERSNDQGDWYSPKFKISGYIDEVQYQVVQPERKALPNVNVNYALLEDNSEDVVDEEKEDEDF